MFGYIRPKRDELKVREDKAYRAAYCGLCRAMSRRFGFRTRFLVNYDMTFLYLLRAAVRDPERIQSCRCPARICGGEACVCDDAGYGPVAAYNMILCWHKLRDNVLDSGFLRSIPYRLALLVLRRPYRKAARQQPAFDRLAEQQLARLNQLEAASSRSIDATADTFARLTAGCVADLEDPAVRRPMETLLYQVGRFIYLTDALDDLADDCKRNAYNPLRFRFTPENGALRQEDLEYLTQLTDSSVNLAGAALELITCRSSGALLENIVYLGMPAVFAAVKQGKFNSHAKDHPRKENYG